MKKFMMTLAAALCCILTLHAQPISEQEAKERALQYMDSNRSSASARRMAAPTLRGGNALTPAATEATKIYAFNIEGGGFVIASGDQRTLPVLGYSTTGSIDWERMPENMRSWLKQYDKAITTLDGRTDFKDGEQTVTPSYGQGATTARPSSRAERVAVEPLVKTHWDQAEPYWNQVPTYQGANPSLRGKQCYVGCVATAMAQVMNYWQWPKAVPDGVPAYDYEDVYDGITKTWHVGAMPPTQFDWDNMADDYGYYDAGNKFIRLETTEAQDKAVATLMRYCGQSVKMMYGPRELGGSGAYTKDVATAFTDCFDYNAAQFISRSEFGIAEWEGVIYGELAAGRPIVYAGSSDQGGHAFVCDGYDGNGLFHINWGWSGLDDGYFSLSVLNPYNNTSAGSGSSGIGFCMEEETIIYTDPQMEQQPTLHGDYYNKFYQYNPISIGEDNVVALSYTFFEPYNEVADHALGTIDEDGNLQPLFMGDPNDSIVCSHDEIHGYNLYLVQIDPSHFTPGQTVTLYPMLRFRHPGEEWQVIPPVEQNLTVGFDDKGEFFLRSNPKTYNMRALDIAITGGTGRLGERNDVTVRVRNNDASDYTKNLNLIPVYLGHVNPEGAGNVHAIAYGSWMKCGAYIPANGEADVTFSFVPEYGGTVVFCVYDTNYRIGELPMELKNDTLTNYLSYVENKSYLSRNGDQWYWNVEMADRIGVKMPHWIPCDSLCLRFCHYINAVKVKEVCIGAEFREYLTALPDSIGMGEYTFTSQMPIDLSQPGDHYLDSYIAYLVDGQLLEYSSAMVQRFTISDPTGIEEIQNPESRIQNEGNWYDLSGRKMANGKLPKGIYIMGGKKIAITAHSYWQ